MIVRSGSPHWTLFATFFHRNRRQILQWSGFDQVRLKSRSNAVDCRREVGRRAEHPSRLDGDGLRWKESLGDLAAIVLVSSDKKKVWGYVDREGRTMIPPQIKNANSFSGGLAAVNCDAYGRYCTDREG